jgi:ELP3 family radical SAM enzyme/protein acetyltransferase
MSYIKDYMNSSSVTEKQQAFVFNVFNRFCLKKGDNLDLQSIIRSELRSFKGVFSKMPNKSDLLPIYLNLVKNGSLEYNPEFENLLTTKIVRSSSGVLPISIALSAYVNADNDNVLQEENNTFSCAFNCSFCPNECVSNGAPKDIARSYLSNEGTFTRGALSDFDTIRQVWRRLAELESMGHLPDKLEIIPLGGTWGCYSKSYRHKFSNDLFYACNSYQLLSIKCEGPFNNLLKKWLKKKPFLRNLPIDLDIYREITQIRPMKTLGEEKEINTKSNLCRIIGIVFETRPDKINRFTLIEKRFLGCTRIQLGIQHTDNDILALNNRGHTVEASVQAIKYCRDAGFKVDIHIMPDLPYTTLDKDYKMICDIFLGDKLQPDYCKLYPCLDLPYTQARKWKEHGLWRPIAENNFREFLDFLCYTLSIIPPWVRVNRVQRDFLEATEKNNYLGFVSDTIKTNLHQIVEQEMLRKGLKCYDIRSREIKNTFLSDDLIDKAKLYIRVYRANEGTEFFISAEIPKDNKVFDDTLLLGLCRLRLPDLTFEKHYLPTFKKSVTKISRIRELHVYGNISSKNSQHKGVGKFLLNVSENISLHYGFPKTAIISGVGVRNYYERLGYSLGEFEDEYMIKDLSSFQPLELFGKNYSSSEIFKKLDKKNFDFKYSISNAYGYSLNSSRRKNYNSFKEYLTIFTTILIVLVSYIISLYIK